jgi:hypothetical protein
LLPILLLRPVRAEAVDPAAEEAEEAEEAGKRYSWEMSRNLIRIAYLRKRQ